MGVTGCVGPVSLSLWSKKSLKQRFIFARQIFGEASLKAVVFTPKRPSTYVVAYQLWLLSKMHENLNRTLHCSHPVTLSAFRGKHDDEDHDNCRLMLSYVGNGTSTSIYLSLH